MNNKKSIALRRSPFRGPRSARYRVKIREAEDRMKGLISDFKDLDTSNLFADAKNPYENIQTDFENVYEDMVGVDTTATDQATEAFNQQQANVLEEMQKMGMVNAQQLANAQLKQQQQVTKELSEQTTRAQMMAAQGASQVQQMEFQAELQKAKGEFTAQQMRLQGAVDARNLEYQKQQGIMALEGGMLEGLRAAKINSRNWFQRTFG
mgnify:FL=1|tara:strand:+ start:377 stop:1000 length:624 start_codon:yes stop_codon:yes gene_type:complete